MIIDVCSLIFVFIIVGGIEIGFIIEIFGEFRIGKI